MAVIATTMHFDFDDPAEPVFAMPHLADRNAVADADALVAHFGDDAGFEAASRADRSRDIGNYLHFCHWRQIERLILLMSVDRAVGTVH